MSSFKPRTAQRQIWHIRHACFDHQPHLIEADVRQRYCYWLYQARRCNRLTLLGYVVAHNHVHLLIEQSGAGESASILQSIASSIEREVGAFRRHRAPFWEAEYCACAVEPGETLKRAMEYLDLQMVRAGEVGHPGAWPHGSYHELQRPGVRRRCVNVEALLRLFGARHQGAFREEQAKRISARIDKGVLDREAVWSEAIAVGKAAFRTPLIRQYGPASMRCRVFFSHSKVA